MSFVSRSLGPRSLVFCLAAIITASVATPAAHAQATTGTSSLDRVLSRMDFGINGVGSFTKDVSGKNYLNQNVDEQTSTTFGALVTIRYTKSPWIGVEGNIGYARYTRNFTTTAPATTPPSAVPYLSVQSNAFEFTLGYVAHPPHPIFGAKPFVGAGYGLLYFHPTSGGGEGLPNQGAGTLYYAAGLDKEVIPHFGFRVQVRQLFYLSPDFYQNYLNVNSRTNTFEPGAGFYIHF